MHFNLCGISASSGFVTSTLGFGYIPLCETSTIQTGFSFAPFQIIYLRRNDLPLDFVGFYNIFAATVTYLSSYYIILSILFFQKKERKKCESKVIQK